MAEGPHDHDHVASFEVRHVSGIHLEPLKVKEHERREAPFSLPRPPFMGGIFGSRGSGKTTCMINLFRLYDKLHAFDKVIIFSPTHEKDPKFEALVESKPNAKLEFVDEYTDFKWDEIVKVMDQELKDYEAYKVALKAYEKFSKGRSIESMSHEELIALYSYDFNNPKAFKRFEYGRPSTLVVFDDMVGDKRVYRGDSSSMVAKFALRHRHYNCSMIFLSQAYRNGIPRQLRNNLSMAVFYANKSDRIKLEVAEEMSSFVSPDTFVAMWDYACAEPHGFFMIDFDAKKPEWRLRKGFDAIIMPADSGRPGPKDAFSERSNNREEMTRDDDPKPASSREQRR